MNSGITYHCPRRCPIRKKCFIIKTEEPIPVQIPVLKKCQAENGGDIRVLIGGNRPP